MISSSPKHHQSWKPGTQAQGWVSQPVRDVDERTPRKCYFCVAHTAVSHCCTSGYLAPNVYSIHGGTNKSKAANGRNLLESRGGIASSRRRLEVPRMVALPMNKATFEAAWHDYKRVRSRAAILTLVFLFLTPVFAYVGITLVGSTVPGLMFALVTMMAAVISTWQYMTWHCPRCGETYGPLRRHCRYCNLSRWGE